jgi:hypothetical protein
MTRDGLRLSVIGSLVLFGGIGLFAWMALGLRRSEEGNRQLSQRQTALVDQIAVLKKRLLAAESKADEAQQTLQANLAAPPKANNDKAWALWRQKFSPFRHRFMTRSMWTGYHDIIDKLNIPPEKKAALLDLLASRIEATQDASEAARAEGITDSKEIDLAVNQARDAVTAEIVDLIGPSDLDAFSRAQELKSTQDQVNRNVGADFQMGGLPLSQEQQTGLAQIYLDLSKQFPTSAPDGTSLPWSEIAQHQTESDAVMTDRASSILSADQMVILKQNLEWNEQRIKVMAGRPE